MGSATGELPRLIAGIMPAALRGADLAVQCGDECIQLRSGDGAVCVALGYGDLLAAVGLPGDTAMRAVGATVKRSSGKGRMVVKLPCGGGV